jgi:hypothetical protein
MNIWVKDNMTGHVHQVGTDPHDSLECWNGVVEYVNMQCMEGTMGSGYSFVEPPDLDDYVSVTPEQLMLNRKMLHADLAAMIEGAKGKSNKAAIKEVQQELAAGKQKEEVVNTPAPEEKKEEKKLPDVKSAPHAQTVDWFYTGIKSMVKDNLLNEKDVAVIADLCTDLALRLEEEKPKITDDDIEEMMRKARR